VTDRWLTPPEIARKLGVDPSKIVGFIRRGELVAANLAEHRGGRPRYRVSPEALQQFLVGRQATPAPKPVRRRRATFERKYYV
jgi:hypothetical protein